jgi:hypothetical protein
MTTLAILLMPNSYDCPLVTSLIYIAMPNMTTGATSPQRAFGGFIQVVKMPVSSHHHEKHHQDALRPIPHRNPMTRLFSKAGSFFFKSRVREMHGFDVSEFSVFYIYGRASTLRSRGGVSLNGRGRKSSIFRRAQNFSPAHNGRLSASAVGARSDMRRGHPATVQSVTIDCT